tara:strand:- start:4357 stop:4596 length:240 start_codon:yes stop_codon:yes gene_type:complete
MPDHKTHAIQYLYQEALADKSKAELSLDLLLNKAAGIGDHSTGDFHQNLREALDSLVDAEDRINLLKERYPNNVQKIDK